MTEKQKKAQEKALALHNSYNAGNQQKEAKPQAGTAASAAAAGKTSTGKQQAQRQNALDLHNQYQRQFSGAGRVAADDSQGKWAQSFQELQKYVSRDTYNADTVTDWVNKLTAEYNRMSRKEKPNASITAAYRALDSFKKQGAAARYQATQKAMARGQTASGLLAEDLENVQKARAEYEEQLKQVRGNLYGKSVPYIARDGKTQSRELSAHGNYGAVVGQYGYEKERPDDATQELRKQEKELTEKIGGIDAVLNIYDRVDRFQNERIQPLTGKAGFASARADYAKRAAERTGKLEAAYAADFDATDTNQRKAYDQAIKQAEEENRDELGEYLNWYEGLEKKTQRKLLSGNLNPQAPENQQLVKSQPSTISKHWERMTADEINAYYYIANTEGMGAAKEYLDELQFTLDRRYTLGREEATREQMEKVSAGGNALRGIATVGANLIGSPMAFAGDVVGKVQGEDFNPYSNTHYLQNISGTIRSEAAADIQKTIAGDGQSAFWNGVAEITANAYQAGLSSLDSMAGMVTMGDAYTVAMGMGAASSRMRELMESGASEQQIYIGAIGSGILEAFFEKVSLDSFSDKFIRANPEKWVKKVLLQAGVEASEEIFTEISNQILDAINRGVNSDHNQRVRELMSFAENPMSRQEAERQATAEAAMEVFWAGFGGAISGGMSSVGGAAIENTRATQVGKGILAGNAQEQLLAEAQELRPNDETVHNLKGKLDAGTLGRNEGLFKGAKDGSDAASLGRVYEHNVADMLSRDSHSVQVAVENRLRDLNRDIRNPEATAQAIVKTITGEKQEVTDKYYLHINQKYADQIRQEIFAADGAEGVDNSWVRSIKTYALGADRFATRELDAQRIDRESMEKTSLETFGQLGKVVNQMHMPGQNRAAYVAEMAEVYRASQNGTALEDVPKTQTLTKDQRELAWHMGQDQSNYAYDNNQGYATIRGETEPVNIVGVAQVDQGQLVLQTDEGETVNAGDVTFGSYEEAKLYSVIAAMGVDTVAANDIVNMSRTGGVNLSRFAAGLQNAFQSGRSGIAFGQIGKDSPGGQLEEKARRMAWEAGQRMRQQKTSAKVKAVQEKTHGKARGGLHIDRSAKTIKKRSAQQEAGMNAAKVLSAMGLDITVYASTEEQRAEGMANGHFRLSDGSIHIDLNAGDGGEGVMGWALSHEFTHFIEEMGAEKFQTFQDVLFNELGNQDQDVQRILEEKAAQLSRQEAYKNYSEESLWELATSEAVAEMMEPMLTDTDAISRISENLCQQDKSLWGKIKDWLTGLVEKLKNAYKDLTPDSSIARQTREIVTQSEAILNAWVEAAADAISNYNLQDGQKNNTPGGVQYSQRYTAENENQDVLNLVKRVQNGEAKANEKVFFGKISQRSAVAIQNITGINVEGFSVALEARQIEHILKRHGENGVADHSMADISNIAKMGYALNSPDSIAPAGKTSAYVSVKNGKNKPADTVLYEKNIGIKSYYVVQAVPETKSKTLYVVSAFIGESGYKNEAPQFTNASSPGATSEIAAVDASSGSISRLEKNSNPEVLHDAIEQEANGQFKLFYLNKNKATKLLQEARVPMPKNPATNNGGYIHSLTDANSPVKTKFSSVTESQQFKRWFGDWQNDPANASKVVNADGTPKVVYHQTGGIFTVFDTRREGAGSRDEGTPFGIFLKSTDRDIGLSGKSQMELYADIKNPLRANNRDDLRYIIIQMSDAYETLIAEHNLIDSEYKAKVDNAIKELREFMAEWRAENPDASRRALYDVPRFNELFEAEDTITDEWTAKIAEVSSKAKEAMTEALEKNGYDGVFLAEDAGSFGRSTDAFIALRPEQVKSATNNLGTFDADNPDIRYSQRTSAQLERENEKLRSDVAYLKELVQIHKHGNKTVVPERGSVNRQAEALKKMAGAKGKTAELAALLNELYRYVGAGKDITNEGLTSRAEKAADWLLDHRKAERDPYAQEVLDWMAKRRVVLSQTQIEEIEYQYGSMGAFKQAIKGSIILDQKANTSLEQLWQEGSDQFADQFDRNITEADMPAAFAEMVETLRSSEDTDSAESAYYRDELRKDLIHEVYDSYFSVKPVESVTDQMQEQINKLKAEKKAQEQQARSQLKAAQEASKNALAGYQAQRDAVDKAMKALYEQQYKEVKAKYRREMDELEAQYHEDSQIMEREFKRLSTAYDHSDETVQRLRDTAKAKVERRQQTELRGKLQRTVNALNRMLLNPTKTQYVPDSLQPAVIEAMEVMNQLRLDDKPNLELIHKYRAEKDALMMESISKNADRIAVINRQLDRLEGRNATLQDALSNMQRLYGELANSNDGIVAQVYDEQVEEYIANALDAVKDTLYSNLTKKQLEAVNDAYAAILHKVRTANRSFANAKGEEISQLAEAAEGELEAMEDRAALTSKSRKALEKFSWNNLKPVYAFRRMGSATFQRLYENLRKGEDTFYRDVDGGRAWALECMSEFHYDTWEDSLVEYESQGGKKFSLNLEERMSLYAYSRREQAIEHLTKGGIVLNENTERTVKNWLGIKRKKIFNDANSYTLSLDTIDAIRESLTEEQRGFAEKMQMYLSTVCAEKNNEISRALYGVSIAKEKVYWPLRSSGLFSEKVRDSQENPGNRQKNAGHMKATVKHANNPIELSGFMETWATHVNNTAMYHSFTLPMEDFYRVYNWKGKVSEDGDSKGIRQLMTAKLGKGAVEYIDQLLKDLNGGVRADPRESIASTLTSKFKKGAVSASLSVAIQQPSAVGRAFAVIDPKYFSLADMRYYVTSTVGQKKAETEWETVKEYAPVAGIKEWGRFDTNMGRSTLDIITGAGESGFLEKLDEISGYLPEKMDQATWLMIWNAAKRQTKAKTGLTGEALLEKTGELFTKCITQTQVYDSVFSRSGNMRSKGLFMNMATSFMAEPTTTANMFQDAMAMMKNGQKGQGARALAAIGSATVLNALLASLVYASRDDDDDKPWKEKYLKSLTSELIESLNPMGYVPIAKDIYSIFQRYDVDRADMTLWGDMADMLERMKSAYEAMEGLDEDSAEYDEQLKAAQKKMWEASWNAVGALANLYGVPAKNVIREVRAIFNTVETVGEDRAMDGATAKYAMWEAAMDNLPELIRDTDSREEELYKAMTSGSHVWIQRMKDSYGDDKSFQSGVRGALREYDPRIRQAAKVLNGNDPDLYQRIVKGIVGEGYFTQEQVDGAIWAEAAAIKGELTDYHPNTVEKFVDLYEDKLLTADQFTDFWEYKGAKDENDKKLHSQDEIIVYISKMRINATAKDKLYLLAGYSEKKLDQMPWHNANGTIYEVRLEHSALKDISDTGAEKFLEVQSEEITAELFANVWEVKQARNEDNTYLYKQWEVIAYIDSLPISDYSKDELYLAFWDEKKLSKAPWNK